jgi:hypothetical protein
VERAVHLLENPPEFVYIHHHVREYPTCRRNGSRETS